MSGTWRVTVDSWISDNANWYARREWVIGSDQPVHDLRAALRAIADTGDAGSARPASRPHA